MNKVSDIQLILKARELVNITILNRLWRNGLSDFFRIIFSGGWVDENQLLRQLCSYVYSFKPKTFRNRRIEVKLGLFCTHKKYIGLSKYREFGDIAFAILIKDLSETCRIGYINVYQFKVGKSFNQIKKGLDTRQLKFYLEFLPNILGRSGVKDLSVISDFLYYWFIIEADTGRRILEIPLSPFWLRRTLKYFRYYDYPGCLPLRYMHGWSFLLNNVYLVSGVKIQAILPFSKPSLRELLDKLLKVGIQDSHSRTYPDESDEYNKYPPEASYKPEYPFDGRIVIAVEIILRA